MNPCTLDETRTAKTRALGEFRRTASVVGVGITRIGDGYMVKVNLETSQAPDIDLPETIDGVEVYCS